MAKRRFSGLEITLMVLFMLMLAVAVAMIALYFVDPRVNSEGGVTEDFVPECPNIPSAQRVDCFPDAGASKIGCEQRGCCWSPLDERNTPWCFFPKNHGYTVETIENPYHHKLEATLTRMDAPSLFGAEIKQLAFHAELQTSRRLHFKISDPNNKRFEVPHEHVASVTNSNTELLIGDVLHVVNEPFGFTVKHPRSNVIALDTTFAPLIFEDQYLQLSTKLPSSNVYGLGEHVHQNFLHDMNWRTWPIFARDAFPNGGTHNLYGHYPFFLCLVDESGKSFGVFLMNSNAMEVTLQPAPAVTYRTIGGVLDFYILFGDNPEQVVDEFLKLIGHPVIPPYWSLGFQLSRWNYTSLDIVKETVERNRAIGLPYDVQYTDIDYMEDKKDFTYDKDKFKDLPQFADYLHDKGQRYILILDPAVATSKRVGNASYESYDRGTEKNAWVFNSDGQTPVLGEVWPGETVFPDYTSDSCTEWWVDEYHRFSKEIKHDALWIDMNEVSNFKKGSINGCADNNLNYPPYTPRILDEVMYSKTLCMDAKQAWGNHYDVHSLYGYSMVLSTDKALKKVFGNKRTLMLTRSSFPGVGKYSGHWLGDNAANWNDIKWAIPGMLEFGLFGIPYIGADICGFFDNSTEELCQRWMQVGAFYPFSRNHNAEGYQPQDPAYYGADSGVATSSKHYLNIRYTLLPYLYTLFYKAHTAGQTVVRPLMHEFYSDRNTWNVDRQFLWGKHLLITPVLDPGVDKVSAYIPNARWYDYETLLELPREQRKTRVEMHLPADKLGLHIRGGAVLPTQAPDVTTTYSRRNTLGLIIALDDNNMASGEFFWDDGESRETFGTGKYIHYECTVKNGILRMTVTHNNYSDDLIFDDITILGVPTPVVSVKVSQHGMGETRLSSSLFSYDADKKAVILGSLGIKMGHSFTVNWAVSEESQRFDCLPQLNGNKTACLARGCIWKPTTIKKVPWCFYPKDHGYNVNTTKFEVTDTGFTLDIVRNAKFNQSSAPVGSPDINTLRVQVFYSSATMLRFKIWDPNNPRYEVPVPLTIPATPEGDATKRLYEVKYKDSPFGIQVFRKSTGVKIWDSALPGFTFSDMFIQVSTLVPSEFVYGFGETEHKTYKHDFNYHTYGMFSKDQPPGDKMNCYGVHPFHMGLEHSTDAHGVLLLNSNAMDVTFQPTPSITYRTIGGILDFFMVLGPTPESVVQQYTELIGRPVLPAYWSLGFQLCRYGYENDQEIADLYHNMTAAGIPYDVQYADIDHMERQLDFVLSPDFAGLPALVDNMRSEGMRFIFILDPAISGNETDYPAFTRGKEADVFIKWPKELSDDIVWGKVWPDLPGVVVNESLDWDTQVELYRAFTAFPDFFRKSATDWWITEIEDFYNNTMKFDGIWIDMNEPASFVHGTVGGKCLGDPLLENPPYMPPLESQHMGLNHKTLCMNSEQILSDGTRVKHYDVHSLYGWSHSKPTYDALLQATGKRGIVVTRSTYPSSGKWVGHWLGDNYSSWDQLFKSIIGMMEFSLFGISYTGADICGFFNQAEYEMCLRWMQLGAFYPYSRNHNSKFNPRQDPVAWNDTFADASRDVLNIRYTLLPYLYTLMYEAHTTGSTVVRPMLHEFVGDKATWKIYRQFLWGPALLITPVLDQGATKVEGYFPDARWYDYHTGTRMADRGKVVTLDTPLNKINLHIRGGYILPWQKPENNTFYSRKNPLGLIMALDDDLLCKGSLFWDDGEGIDTVGNHKYLHVTFSGTASHLNGRIVHDGLDAADQLTLGTVKVLGALKVNISRAVLTDSSFKEYPLTVQQNHDNEELIIDTSSASFLVNQTFTIRWYK
ncbi:sucrase-isomaltase, intestinal [Nelusetta ayraudi]|uniref:sucrase-isomaltase, intestinal n=1 Tax=Nelusetta ayraudi TaxID=303726 RepID=UPI003F726CD9